MNAQTKTHNRSRAIIIRTAKVTDPSAVHAAFDLYKEASERHYADPMTVTTSAVEELRERWQATLRIAR